MIPLCTSAFQGLWKILCSLLFRHEQEVAAKQQIPVLRSRNYAGHRFTKSVNRETKRSASLGKASESKGNLGNKNRFLSS